MCQKLWAFWKVWLTCPYKLDVTVESSDQSDVRLQQQYHHLLVLSCNILYRLVISNNDSWCIVSLFQSFTKVHHLCITTAAVSAMKHHITIRDSIHCPGTVDVFNWFEHIKINHNKATHIFVQIKPEIFSLTKIWVLSTQEKADTRFTLITKTLQVISKPCWECTYCVIKIKIMAFNF